MYENLYKHITNPLCSILVYLNEEKISEGSGFAISNDGIILTAAHVVTGRMPIQERDYKDPNVKIIVKFPDMNATEYQVGICGINIGTAALTETVQIDQALLVPKTPLHLPFECFTIGSPPKLGKH